MTEIETRVLCIARMLADCGLPLPPIRTLSFCMSEPQPKIAEAMSRLRAHGQVQITAQYFRPPPRETTSAAPPPAPAAPRAAEAKVPMAPKVTKEPKDRKDRKEPRGGAFDDEISRLWSTALSSTEIGAQIGCPSSYVLVRARRLGLPKRRRGYRPASAAAARTLANVAPAARLAERDAIEEAVAAGKVTRCPPAYAAPVQGGGELPVPVYAPSAEEQKKLRLRRARQSGRSAR